MRKHRACPEPYTSLYTGTYDQPVPSRHAKLEPRIRNYTVHLHIQQKSNPAVYASHALALLAESQECELVPASDLSLVDTAWRYRGFTGEPQQVLGTAFALRGAGTI